MLKNAHLQKTHASLPKTSFGDLVATHLWLSGNPIQTRLRHADVACGLLHHFCIKTTSGVRLAQKSRLSGT